jgi:hypothetical protein
VLSLLPEITTGRPSSCAVATARTEPLQPDGDGSATARGQLVWATPCGGAPGRPCRSGGLGSAP